MNNELDASRTAPTHDYPLGAYYPPAGGTGEAHATHRPQVNVAVMAHRILRGRYLIALGLAAFGAAIGGVVGYKIPRVQYRGEAVVRVSMDTPRVYNSPGQNNILSVFTSFVSTQAQLLQHQRVISKAMAVPEWQARERGASAADIERDFRDRLRVTTSPTSMELITVAFMDESPAVAFAVAKGVVDAYREIFSAEEGSRAAEAVLSALDNRIKTLGSEIDIHQKKLTSLTTNFGSDDIELLYENYNQRYLTILTDLNTIRARLAPHEDTTTAAVGGDAALTAIPPEPKVLSNEEIAQVDDVMRAYMTNRRSLQNDLNRHLANGKGEGHRMVTSLRTDIAVLDETITTYAREFNVRASTSNTGHRIAANSGAPQAATVDQLKTQLSNLNRQAEDWKRQLIELGNTRLAMRETKRTIEELRVKLADTERRYDEGKTNQSLIDSQRGAVGRISFMVPDAPPTLPASDARLRTAAVGVVLGGGFPIAVIALIGLLDRRFRYSDQARDSGGAANIPLLGILPHLPKDLDDPDQTIAAAHCIHQMRSILQISAAGRKVYAVTSSTAGDGKTSLALSLGISFAASGSRTLLVDFDLIGRGLTNNLKVNAEHGMADALRAGSTNGSILPTRIDRLSILPTLRGDDRFVSRLSKPMVQELIDSVRDQYDIVIIDTGPILGSLEAHYVTAAADGVVLVVGRGQHQSQVQRATDLLTKIGARMVGLVFNRAFATDFIRSTTSASIRSIRSIAPGDSPHPPLAKTPEVASDLDPISRTVAIDLAQ